MQTTATLVSHLGLGDCILISGAAVVLSERYDKLRVPAYKMYLESVRSFYAYYPSIEVYAIENPPGSTWGVPPISRFDIIGEALLCGYYSNNGTPWHSSFPQWFYSQLGVAYHHRWDSCPIGASWITVKQKIVPAECVVHDDASRGFRIEKNISDTAYRLPFSSESVLEHAYAIQNASEIHCIDSSIYHLVECLETGADLYLHRYARHHVPNWFDYPSRKSWSVLT